MMMINRNRNGGVAMGMHDGRRFFLGGFAWTGMDGGKEREGIRFGGGEFCEEEKRRQ
jgi:hypothetical protein